LASSTLATVTFSFFREQEGQGAPTENILNGKKPNRVQQEYNEQRAESIAKQRKEKATVTFYRGATVQVTQYALNNLTFNSQEKFASTSQFAR
jgi:hypothetical protein